MVRPKCNEFVEDVPVASSVTLISHTSCFDR